MALLGITSRASVAGVMNGVPAAVFHRSVLRQHRFGPFKTQRLVICFRAFPVGGAVGLALGGLGPLNLAPLVREAWIWRSEPICDFGMRHEAGSSDERLGDSVAKFP